MTMYLRTFYKFLIYRLKLRFKHLILIEIVALLEAGNGERFVAIKIGIFYLKNFGFYHDNFSTNLRRKLVSPGVFQQANCLLDFKYIHIHKVGVYVV
jgi:hypothetical protein